MLNTGSGKWPCVKTCNCFVLAQECLLCTPVCLNICTLGLAMVGLAFLSVTLNGSKPDIVLSTTPLKLALIFVHMYFAWGLFASVKWAAAVAEWTK